MNPVESESSTEKASRIECSSCGGNLDKLSVCAGIGEFMKPEPLRAAAPIDRLPLSDADVGRRPRVVGEGGGSVCDLVAIGLISISSSWSSAVNDCFNLEGDVIGETPVLLGGVDGLPMMVVGDDGEEGLRKGDARGELNDKGDGL